VDVPRRAVHDVVVSRILRVGALLALGASGCPGAREGDADKTAAPTSPPLTAAAPQPPPLSPVLASATSAPVDERIVPLVPGQPLAQTSPVEGEVFGAELLFEVRLRGMPSPPVHLGANPTSIVAAQNAAVGVLRVTLGAGRARARFGARAFAMEDGWELRADRHRGGSILLLPHEGALVYRVIPTGALRPLLAERRVDVIALGPTHLAPIAEPASLLGRSLVRTRVTTAWGSLDLEQVVAPTSARPTIKQADARPTPADAEPETQGLEGGGEAWCRSLLELIAADRSAAGPPCSMNLVPVRADVQFVHGGGLVLTATSLREGPVPRADLAFPPSTARMLEVALPEPKFPLAPAESLFSLRTKGESCSLDLVDKAPAPRLALIDGVPAYMVPAGGDARVSLHAGRYVLEWRTPLGEVVERAVELDAPGRATTAQWVPAPLSSASPMASARNGP
jgi:hypothetical protein